MEYRRLSEEEKPAALALSLRVFMQFEAPEYSAEGIRRFDDSLHDTEYTGQLWFYGAVSSDGLCGILATRNGGSHIALFFVEEACHRQGIGRRLFALAAADCPTSAMTVNASPYAVEVYRHLGFTTCAPEQCTDGLRYTPMVWRRGPNTAE